MNKKIQELARDYLRHEMYASYGEIFKDDYYEFSPEELQNFVQSIVKECANRASWAQDTGAKDIGGEVLKHFGVSE